MKKKYLIGLMVCVFVFASVNHANAASDYREQVRKKWVADCVEGMKGTKEMSKKARLQFCQCSVDKIMAHYNDHELKELRTIEDEMASVSNPVELKQRLSEQQVKMSEVYLGHMFDAVQECKMAWKKQKLQSK